MVEGWTYRPPPDWPRPPSDWSPRPGWRPDPAWGPVPPGWQLWVPERVPHRRPRLMLGAALAGLLAIALSGSVMPRSAVADVVVGGVVPSAVPPRTVPPRTVPPRTVPPRTVPPRTVPPRTVRTVPRPVRRYRSCVELNRIYPTGVGMPSAIDRTAGVPVTNFGRSARLFRANAELDTDGDQIVCE